MYKVALKIYIGDDKYKYIDLLNFNKVSTINDFLNDDNISISYKIPDRFSFQVVNCNGDKNFFFCCKNGLTVISHEMFNISYQSGEVNLDIICETEVSNNEKELIMTEDRKGKLYVIIDDTEYDAYDLFAYCVITDVAKEEDYIDFHGIQFGYGLKSIKMRFKVAWS